MQHAIAGAAQNAEAGQKRDRLPRVVCNLRCVGLGQFRAVRRNVTEQSIGSA